MEVKNKMGEVIKVIHWICAECGKDYDTEEEAKECCN